MRFFPIYAFLAVLAILAAGCTGIDIFGKGDLPLPEISITSITQDGDSTRVAVDIVQGYQPLDFLGLAFSQEPGFTMEDNQQLFPLEEAGSVEIALARLEPENTYYFQAFLGDVQFYAESEVASFFIPRPSPPDIPCELTLNTISNQAAVYDVYFVREVNPTGFYTNYGLSLEAGRVTMTFSFNTVPNSGTYTTVSNPNKAIDSRDVYGSLQIGGFQVQFGSFDEGQDLFVEKIGDKHFIVSFCEWTHNLGTSRYSGQVETK